jgi:hypothetical protein
VDLVTAAGSIYGCEMGDAIVPMKIVWTVLLVLVVGKFFVAPQIRSVVRSAKRPWLGLFGVALISVPFVGIATMPIIAGYRHIDDVLIVLACLSVVGATAMLLAGSGPEASDDRS